MLKLGEASWVIRVSYLNRNFVAVLVNSFFGIIYRVALKKDSSLRELCTRLAMHALCAGHITVWSVHKAITYKTTTINFLPFFKHIFNLCN